MRGHGDGFKADEEGKAATFGLFGVRERAYMLGGEATIDSQPGQGVCVSVRLPVTRMPVTS